MNGFGPGFLLDTFKKHMKEWDFYYYQPKSGRYDFITHYLHLKKMRKDELSRFDILHCNVWSNMTNMVPNQRQVGIAHWHGFSIGLNSKNSLKHSQFFSHLFGTILNRIVENKIISSVKKYDIVYAAIPSILPTLKYIRKDAQWLPNPINTDIFNPTGEKIQLEGNPIILFPTRLHKVKSPEFGFKIFSKIKEKCPSAKLHLVKYPKRFSQYGRYKSFFETYKDDIIWHNFFPRNDLPKLYRSADLVLGSFWQGVLSLVELEAMACGTAVVCNDQWEIIKKKNSQLPNLALKLIKNVKFRESFIKKCTQYVHTTHSEHNVCLQHLLNIKNAQIKKGITHGKKN